MHECHQAAGSATKAFFLYSGEADAVLSVGIYAEQIAHRVAVVVVQDDAIVAEHILQVGGCIGIVHTRLRVFVDSDTILHQIARQIERLVDEVAGHASAHCDVSALVADVHLSHSRHLSGLGQSIEIGCGRHVANALYDDVLAFQDGAVVHDGGVVFVLIATEDIHHCTVGIAGEGIVVETTVVRDVDVGSVILLEGFLQEVRHLRTVDASLAGELLDERCALEVVLRHIKLRHTRTRLLCKCLVHIRHPARPIGGCALGASCPQLCHDDGAAVGLKLLGQRDVLVCRLSGALALHGYCYVVDGVWREVMDVEPAGEVLVGSHRLRVCGVLCVGGVVEGFNGIVVEQGEDEQRAAVGVFLPRLLALIDEARLRNSCLCKGHQRMGLTERLIGLHAQEERLVANDVWLVEHHVVPTFREIGIGLAYDVLGLALAGEDAGALLASLLIVGTHIAAHTLHLTSLQALQHGVLRWVELRQSLHELVLVAAQRREILGSWVGRSIAVGHL